MTQYFMNPKTGKVRSAEQWRSDNSRLSCERFARWAASTLIEVREPLTEYEYDKYGAWVPVSVDDNNNDEE
jgi:hypothetical protein